MDQLSEIAAKKGVTPSQLAIGWVAAQGADTIPIAGTKNEARMKENFASREITFSDGELKEIRDTLAKFPAAGDRCAYA